jgi:hypothetical protein
MPNEYISFVKTLRIGTDIENKNKRNEAEKRKKEKNARIHTANNVLFCIFLLVEYR